MKKLARRWTRLAPARVVAALLALGWTAPVISLAAAAQAQNVVVPRAGAPGAWRALGQTHANHKADHDTIVVRGPFDNFRRLKFKVTDAPLNMLRMVVVYDNGAPEKIDVRQNIRQGGESREIDLRGVGKRSIRRIDFWYETKGLLQGKADVTVFGRK